jgi:hypothetical protein
MAVGNFSTTNQLDWVVPTGWIDISNVANNEINLLVGEGSMAFTVNTASGTYSVDWGDGTIETGRTSGTAYDHTYTWGTGTATPYGYTVRKVRIYGASGNITRFQTAAAPTASGTQTQSRGMPLLWLAMGTTGLTSCQYLCGVVNNTYPSQLQCVQLPPVLTSITSWDNAFYESRSLQKVIGLNSTWGSVTSISNMFQNCNSIRRIDFPPALPSTITNMTSAFSGCASLITLNMPSTWPSAVTSYAFMFQGCTSLTSIQMPTSWGTGTTTTSSMFNACTTLQSITLPSAGFPNTVTDVSSMFANCHSLTSINFGSSWGSSAFNANSLIGACRNLQEIIFPSNQANMTSATTLMTGVAPSTALLQKVSNLDKLGSLSTSITFTNFCQSIFYTGGTISSLVSQIVWAGANTTSKLGLSTLRLSNASSTYGGTTPQINVSYTNLGQSALVNLFNDLPTLVGKTINITGATGAAALTAPERAIATGKGWTIIG